MALSDVELTQLALESLPKIIARLKGEIPTTVPLNKAFKNIAMGETIVIFNEGLQNVQRFKVHVSYHSMVNGVGKSFDLDVSHINNKLKYSVSNILKDGLNLPLTVEKDAVGIKVSIENTEAFEVQATIKWLDYIV